MSNKKSTSPFLVVMAIFLFLLSLYLVTPTLYQTVKIEQYKDTFNQFVEEIKNTNDFENVALEYALENDAIVSIENASTQGSIQTPIIKSVRSYQQEASITNAYGQTLAIDVQYTFASLSDINAILIVLLPIIGVCLFIAYLFLCNQPSSKKESLKDFYQITEDMLRMKPKARLPISSKNKTKQDVARNINDLYELLLEKQEQLEQINKDYQILLDSSNDTIRSLQADLHDDINEILYDVKAMINNQGRYRNHAIYLMEIKVKLEALLSQKNRNKPLPSTIHEIFQQLLDPYALILQQKQVNIVYQLESNFKIKADDLLFNQAINHLMAFVMNQCLSQSQINVIQTDYDISIAYKGACLTEESISKVESLDENVKACYRYVQQLGFFIDFMQTEEKDGMQFVFHF